MDFRIGEDEVGFGVFHVFPGGSGAVDGGSLRVHERAEILCQWRNGVYGIEVIVKALCRSAVSVGAVDVHHALAIEVIDGELPIGYFEGLRANKLGYAHVVTGVFVEDFGAFGSAFDDEFVWSELLGVVLMRSCGIDDEEGFFGYVWHLCGAGALGVALEILMNIENDLGGFLALHCFGWSQV